MMEAAFVFSRPVSYLFRIPRRIMSVHNRRQTKSTGKFMEVRTTKAEDTMERSPN